MSSGRIAHPHRQRALPHVFLWPDGTKGDVVNLGPYVRSFTWTKSLAGALGQWSVDVLPYAREDSGQLPPLRLPELYRRCRANGVITIGMDQPGGIGMGLIDDVNRSRTHGARAGSALHLSGSDMAKPLHLDNIVHASLALDDYAKFEAQLLPIVGPEHSLLQNLQGVWGPANVAAGGAEVFVAASIDAVIKWIVDVGPSMQVPLLASLTGTGRPGEYIDVTRSITQWNTSRIFGEQPHSYLGNVWGFIRSVIDEDIYEVWVDSIPGAGNIPQIMLIVRPKPFDEPLLNFAPITELSGIGWKDIRTLVTFEPEHVLMEDDIFAEQLGHSDRDVFSYYLVASQHEVMGNVRTQQNGLLFPLVDTYALSTAGLRSYNANLSLIHGDKKRVQDNDVTFDQIFASEVTEFRNRMFNWYRCNKWFENGTLTVRGQDKYRVGDPVFAPHMFPAHGTDQGVRFYTTGISHSWSVGQRYTTTLQVTRGHNDSTINAAKDEIRRHAIKAGVPDLAHFVEVSR